jgi:uncharacterized membrane protein
MLHLIHPALVHVTFAFLVVGGVAEAYGILRRREGVERFGGTLVILGTVSLVPAIVAGFLAENALTLSIAGEQAVDRHERLGLLVLGVFIPLVLAKAWGRGRPPENWRGLYAAGLALGVAAVLAAAYLGGFMVYELGVGVTAP